ncbi:competence protein ComK [Sporosarcina oncorhynchi]|uniref:Competence protein ComK n=1 Tax=Sporosarcina oncorhynchi TaxID=3056444 RepID=A0ABZ0L9Y6_9BACL|nr:competence protein ComK [Sporosarcina sp. T2O-4]WOV88324.1 competence protein ComK [Sporosarcina sp. T2O-4]
MDKLLNNYFVSFDTLALHPLTIGNKVFTQVIERDRTFTVSKKPIHIVTRSCSYYGSNLARAMHTSHHVLGKMHKVPIMLANAYGVPFIFIPTMSPTSDQNVWISYHAVQNFKKDGLDTSMTLENGKNLNLNISTSTFYRQYSLARLIEIDFLKNHKRMDRSTYLFPSKELKKVQEPKESDYKKIDNYKKEPDKSGEDN